MKNYAVRITGKRTEYSEYNITIQANSLAEAKKKAAEIAEDEDGEFENSYSDEYGPGDAYTEFTVQDVKLKGDK